jgi:hypothetical protein
MQHHFIQPLLGFDFTELAITAVVLFFAVMKQLFDASSKSTKKSAAAMPGQPPQRVPPAAPKPPAPVGQQADALRSQVEEFLRRAGGSPQTNQAPAPAQRPVSEIEVLVRQPQRPPQPQSLADSRAMPSTMPSAPGEKQRGFRRGRRRQSVAEHVAERVTASTQTLAEKAAQLGQRLVVEDQQFESHVKSKFDHALGALGESDAKQAPAAAPAETPASQIAAMLANPAGVRQAMVVNEILRRPSDRW